MRNKLPAIRFIVETISSERDRSGNCYHWSRITSTLTGKSFRFHADGRGNAATLVHKMTGCEYDAIRFISINLPKRQWKHSQDRIKLYEHQVTAEHVLSLESNTLVGISD